MMDLKFPVLEFQLIGILIWEAWIDQWLEAEVIQIHCGLEFATAFDALADEICNLTCGLVEKVVSPSNSPHIIYVVLDLSLFALI